MPIMAGLPYSQVKHAKTWRAAKAGDRPSGQGQNRLVNDSCILSTALGPCQMRRGAAGMPIVNTLFSDLGEALYCLVIFGVLTAECLLVVWAATSSGHRLLRALVVWAAIVALIPIRAYAPALVLAINGVLVAAIIILARR